MTPPRICGQSAIVQFLMVVRFSQPVHCRVRPRHYDAPEARVLTGLLLELSLLVSLLEPAGGGGEETAGDDAGGHCDDGLCDLDGGWESSSRELGLC